jgi:hypothetical protein
MNQEVNKFLRPQVKIEGVVISKNKQENPVEIKEETQNKENK